MDRIKEFWDNLPLKYKICVLIVITIILLILTRIMTHETTSNEYTKNLQYKDLTAETLLESYSETYTDRDSYLILENIVSVYSSLYTGEESIYKDYYDVLDSNYSKYISKRKFITKINQIFSKVEELGGSYTINMYECIQESDIYIVEILSDTEKIGYIGIILDRESSIYSIFYVE